MLWRIRGRGYYTDPVSCKREWGLAREVYVDCISVGVERDPSWLLEKGVQNGGLERGIQATG